MCNAVAALDPYELSLLVDRFGTCILTMFDTAIQERFEYIHSQLLPFLKSVGFKEQSLQWLPAVGPAGQNLNTPPTEPLLSSWWRGPTLVEAIDKLIPKPRNAGGCCCMPQ
jgi:elongation factor 1 alpha-like protein